MTQAMSCTQCKWIWANAYQIHNIPMQHYHIVHTFSSSPHHKQYHHRITITQNNSKHGTRAMQFRKINTMHHLETLQKNHPHIHNSLTSNLILESWMYIHHYVAAMQKVINTLTLNIHIQNIQTYAIQTMWNSIIIHDKHIIHLKKTNIHNPKQAFKLIHKILAQLIHHFKHNSWFKYTSSYTKSIHTYMSIQAS